MGKYGPLHEHLKTCGAPSLRMRFTEIERLIGDTLPASARKYAAWWANPTDGTHTYARAWLDAGYRTCNLDLNAGTVEFTSAGAPR